MQQPLQPIPSHVVFRTHHELHRSGKHLRLDAEVDVDFGDGTPEWLLEALRYRSRDPWRPEHDSWHAVRHSWEIDSGAAT